MARAALLACVGGLTFIVRVCLWRFPALVPDSLRTPNIASFCIAGCDVVASALCCCWEILTAVLWPSTKRGGAWPRVNKRRNRSDKTAHARLLSCVSVVEWGQGGPMALASGCHFGASRSFRASLPFLCYNRKNEEEQEPVLCSPVDCNEARAPADNTG